MSYDPALSRELYGAEALELYEKGDEMRDLCGVFHDSERGLATDTVIAESVTERSRECTKRLEKVGAQKHGTGFYLTIGEHTFNVVKSKTGHYLTKFKGQNLNLGCNRSDLRISASKLIAKLL